MMWLFAIITEKLVAARTAHSHDDRFSGIISACGWLFYWRVNTESSTERLSKNLRIAGWQTFKANN
jgi:hypothetical protein